MEERTGKFVGKKERMGWKKKWIGKKDRMG